ncbi:uncharacterized protein LOC115967382 [Quercus lobata]|uniref:uncharacterized protein LOC115967382 n=1 Tax=Quercus lobata TaxID=97700 RepID=UPI001246DDE1|nr:uncharacterized protein LOC115967382 [Quercus lobata]
MADDQVPCHQGSVAATNPLRDTQGGEKLGYSGSISTVSGRKEFILDDEVTGAVAMAEEDREQWVMKFDGSYTTQSRGVRVVLYHEEDKAVVLSFKLEFPCSNNMEKYEAYLTGLAMALEIGVKHLKVMGDSNLVNCQAKGIFSLKEPSLAPYRAMA